MKEQIVEMAKIIAVQRGYDCAAQENCDASCIVYKCHPYAYAEILYNAGYRKQREGEWIVTNSDGVWHYDCPFCDDGYAQKEKLPAANYCENCGARLYDPKMKGATDER